MKRRLWICIALAGVAVQSVWAETLTWEQCLERTKQSSPELVSARAAVRELEFSAASAGAGFLPDVSVSAGADYGENESASDWNESKGASGSVNLSQDLFSGGGNVAKRKRALAQLKIGRQQYRSTLADVEQRVRLAFVEVLYAQELMELTEKIAQRRSDNVRLIQLRFDGGRENAGSLARSKAQLAQAEFEAREAQRLLTYALRNLAAAMGEAAPQSGADGALQAVQPDELEDLKGLMKQTPDYAIAETQVEASKQGMQVTRSGRFPKVTFRASAGLADRSGYDQFNGSWDMGLNASMSLFTGGQLRNDVAAAKEKVVQSEMDLLDTANSLMATLQQRWNNYVGAVDNEAVQVMSLEAEELRAEISTAKYKQGLLDYENWDIIENNLISQEKTLLQRRRTAEIEQARWKNALGQSVWQPMNEGR